jgi:type 2 lantibiotic biosynthesis protein LanM
MNQNSFQASAWYNAIELTQRIASLKADPNKILNFEVNSELSQQRLNRWRSQVPFKTESYFDQRLQLDGITEDEFIYLLGESVEAIKDRFSEPPEWLASLERVFCYDNESNLTQLPSSEELEEQEIRLFLYAIEPLICQGRDRLRETINKLSQDQNDLPFDPNTVEEILVTNLPGKLLNICSRTMVLELQIASLQERLQGDNPQARFYSFVESLRQQEQLIKLFQEYPIMARQLIITIEQWVRFSGEFLERLCADWQEIRTIFSPEKDPGQLVEFKSGEGDSHRGGRSVAIAEFSSGFQLVYKPRSLAIDVHFQELLTWLNQKGDRISFRTIKILDRHSHGWVEFVAAQTCTSEEAIERFYERQGGYLALLYLLEATDFHSENLIAAGEYPVLIDLESLFHPYTAQVDSTQTKLTKSNQLAINALNYSVLRSGLLPQRIWSNGDNDGVDISGLGAQKGQLTPFEVPYWEAIGTDRMQLKRKRMEIPGTHNQPTLNDAEVSVLDRADALSTGFTTIYHLLLKHREQLLSEDSPIAKFAKDEIRVIIRPTRFYALLLIDSLHPKMLCNALERERLFDRLWFGIEQQPQLARLIRAEREDLWNGDVPMFTTYANSTHLLTTNQEQISNFFERSGMDLVKSRLQQLSETDLKLQLRLIDRSLTALILASEPAQMTSYPLGESQSIASREQLITAAVDVAKRLEELAFKGDNDLSWIGLKPVNERYCSLISLGADLYDGLSGIALFFAYLGAISAQKHYTSLARATLVTIRSQIAQSKESFKSIGGFEGWGGIIYTLTHLAMLWDEPELLTEAEELVKLIPPLIEKDKGLDIIAGAAGCMMSLLALYRCAPSESTLAVAISCGDRLISQVQKMPQGMGWTIPNPEPNSEQKPLTGFAHGAAGIASALLELAAITGEERFFSIALEGIAYERSLFIPNLGNWPDLRNFSDRVLSSDRSQHYCMTAWCHGAPGIGLARLRSLPYLNDAEIRAEIDIALQTTVTSGFGSNHSLCHGDLGNLELLLQANLAFNNQQSQERVDRFTAIVLESIKQHGWLCGMPLGAETPGLMTGLAGIGYGLLRLAEPERVSSVLLLEAPKLKGRRQKAEGRLSKYYPIAVNDTSSLV